MRVKELIEKLVEKEGNLRDAAAAVGEKDHTKLLKMKKAKKTLEAIKLFLRICKRLRISPFKAVDIGEEEK